MAPNAVKHHPCDVESGSRWTASGSEISVNSREESACPLNVPLEHVNQSQMCCSPFSSTLPDYPTIDHHYECNVSNMVDSSKTSKEIRERCDKPENEQSLIVAETQPPNQENSYVDSTSKDLSSSERRGVQMPVQSTVEADVKDKSICDAAPDDLSRVIIADQVQALPASLCSALPVEDTKDANINVNTTAGVMEPPQQQVRQAEAAQTKEVDIPPTEQILKLPDHPCLESPPKAQRSGHCPGDEDIVDCSALCSTKKYRSSFEWATFPRKKVSPIGFSKILN